MDKLVFFDTTYQQLRHPHKPMNWMRRMFCDVINGSPPSLVDLPTAAGKTDVVVIWLIALAWYVKNRDTASPVPRRLVWVINRRVLVQQVDDMAKKLVGKLLSESGDYTEFANLLRELCKGKSGPVFNVVQLRGQRLDDREWTLDPTIPQLIIGTVDQIGSRLLFQGYGLGKWSRPHHAGILGVDAWICVDEAHLVPSFVVTLRQVREIASRPVAPDVPEFIKSALAKLPFWVSELSATPGLPKPKFGKSFILEKEKGDEDDNAIIDRLRAKMLRRVVWEPLPEKKKLDKALAEKALGLPSTHSGGAIAVFCSAAKVADAVAKEIEKKHAERVLLVTGRIRGYERDRLSKSDLFKQFRDKADTSRDLPAFLVGTAAAEVGLDADAESIVCDFAPLPTLVQRLGRLDRIGRISSQLNDDDAPDRRPTMTIIGDEKGKTGEKVLEALATGLSDANSDQTHEFRPDYFSGYSWKPQKEKEENEETDQSEDEKKKEEKIINVEDIVLSATWKILTPESSKETSKSANWLSHKLAGITPGPVVLPPLTDAVLRRWAATTPPRPHFLPVHPWLYGLLPNDEGIPLVGIAFRLEMDILKHCATSHENEEDGDDGNDAKIWDAVLSCLSDFPPLRSEFHFVPIYSVRQWLSENRRFTFAHFDGDEWTTTISPNELTAASVLVFPTSTALDEIKIGKEELILKSGEQHETQRCWDVFDALAKDGAKYRREITVSRGVALLKPNKTEDGIWRIPDTRPDNEEESKDTETVFPVLNSSKWKRSGGVLSFAKDDIIFELRYFRPVRDSGNGFELLDDHLKTTANFAKQIAAAIAPGNQEFDKLLFTSGQYHDPGKDHDKWQRVMGNTPSWRADKGYNEAVRIAKPVVENPGNAGGYRHEWGSLWKIKDDPEKTGTDMFFRDLLLHLIVAHHGRFRPSMPEKGFDCPPTPTKQNPTRIEAIERFASLQSKLGYWRLAYLEGLIKAADVAASRDMETPEVDQ
jgi:CRISPR-associated endonuclease/helicase Cas3